MATILLVTVTKIEAQAVFKTFGVSLQRYLIGDKTYYPLGNLNGIEIFMVQSEMGTASPGGALVTIQKAIEDLKPFAVILVGVAFGIKPAEHRIGEILVSKQIMAYESGRINRGFKFCPCGDRTMCSTVLLDKLRSGDLDWGGAKVHFGLLLSGEKLIADQKSIGQLLKLEPEAIGVEMEGAGLYVAASQAKVDWILVKAIGWNLEEKNDDSQIIAAENASSFVLHALRGIDHQPDANSTDKAVKGLYALIAKMKEPQTRKAMREFRIVIKETERYFQALRNEKLIHDALHRLQFRYSPLVNEAKRFPFDGISVDSLKAYTDEYGEILDELEKMPKNDRDSGWMFKLKDVARLLNETVETNNVDCLEKALRYLHQVLELQPSIINTRLNTVTRMIDLRKIDETLASIDEKLDSPTDGHEDSFQFKEGISELVNLTVQLKVMVYKHDQWQQIDNELQLIEGAITLYGISELEASWPRIKLLACLQQTAMKEDTLFDSMMATQSIIDNMLIQKNIPAIMRYFDTYRSQTKLIFHKVDRELKDLCDDLMKIGEPLAAIVQLVEDE